MDYTVITMKQVPKRLKDRFKSICADRGQTMKESILAFMAKELEKDDKKRGRVKK